MVVVVAAAVEELVAELVGSAAVLAVGVGEVGSQGRPHPLFLLLLAAVAVAPVAVVVGAVVVLPPFAAVVRQRRRRGNHGR